MVTLRCSFCNLSLYSFSKNFSFLTYSHPKILIFFFFCILVGWIYGSVMFILNCVIYPNLPKGIEDNHILLRSIDVLIGFMFFFFLINHVISMWCESIWLSLINILCPYYDCIFFIWYGLVSSTGRASVRGSKLWLLRFCCTNIDIVA